MNRRGVMKSLIGSAVATALSPARAVILRGGAAILASGASFDFFISPTGSDTNAGTLASPWAITAINTKSATYAGKRLGLLPGTYSVASLMGTNEAVAALSIASGSSPAAQTYIASSDSSGNYSPRTATLDGALRASFTADIGTSTTATFSVSQTAHSNQVTLSSITGTPQAGMQLTGGSLSTGQKIPSPVYLVSLVSGNTWTTDYTSIESWSATGMTGTVASLTVDSLSSGTIARGMVLSNGSLPAGTVVTFGSGTSWTVGASIASPLTAISITGTLYGGDNNNLSPIIAGRGGKNFWVVDGIKFTGFSMWAFHVGDSPSGGVNPISWFIQNCEFTGGNCTYPTQANFANGVNCGAIIVYCSTNGTITNNWFHDNTYNPRDQLHWSCLYQWGLGTSATVGTTFTFNSIKASGNLQGKEAVQYNTEIAYNYIDMTGLQAVSDVTGCAIYGFMSDNGLGTLTKWHHNVILANDFGLDFDNTNVASAYLQSPLNVYNNTIVCIGKQADGFASGGYDSNGTVGSAGHLTAYNNLYYDNGQTPSQYGYWLTNVDSFALLDFNIYGTWSKFLTVPATHYGSSGATTHASLAAWAASLTGGTFEANSTTSSTNPFTGVNTGLLASAYQLSAGYAHRNFGRVGGVIGGAVCDVGAWDGTVTQIGCNFA